MYREPDIDEIIGENGETLKFISSRSREYLQERKLSDLATPDHRQSTNFKNWSAKARPTKRST